MINKSAGFTLLELMVVIAIVGLLSTVVFGSLSDSKDKAKEVVALKEIRKLNEAIFMYELDTSTKFVCNLGEQCTDKLFTNPGVSGWDGPYFESVNHPWGGRVIVANYFTPGSSGSSQTLIYLTNDQFNGDDDRSRKIPKEVMVAIDEALDDGELSTGLVTSNAVPRVGLNVDDGELLIKPEI